MNSAGLHGAREAPHKLCVMRIETLVVTIDQRDHSLVERMNLQTDAVVGNQCQCTSWEELFLKNGKVTYLNMAERGVGKNRNAVLQNATADICVFADDDMTFVDGYPQIVERAFAECPEGDVLIFNLIEKHPRRYENKKIKRIRQYNYAKYGAARLVIRRQRVADAGITFSTMFGGGARYGSGEDTIFLKECLDKGLRVYAVPYAIAEIDQSAASSWFTGYNEKYFYDRGALYASMYPLMWRAIALRFLLRHCHSRKGGMAFRAALKNMLRGGMDFLAERKENSRCGSA